jgi:hypothetical protein
MGLTRCADGYVTREPFASRGAVRRLGDWFPPGSVARQFAGAHARLEKSAPQAEEYQ